MYTDPEFDQAEVREVQDHARECFARAIASTNIQGMHPADARDVLWHATVSQPACFDTSLFWLEDAFDDALSDALDDYFSA